VPVQSQAEKAAEESKNALEALARLDIQRFSIPDLGMDIMPIPAGTFQMGTANWGHYDERPETRVTISRPFWLARTEVTQGQWQAVMGDNPSQPASKWDDTFKGDNLPVNSVSWNAAMEFCRKLTERERAAGRLPEGYAYTLPTEAQWEYAARAGTTTDYGGTGLLNDMGWHGGNSSGRAQTVGTKAANAWGLHDMHGNLWELCRDWYGTYFGGSQTDPTGLPSGSDRVIRGGAYWVDGGDTRRSAFRHKVSPDVGNNVTGFRPALSSAPAR
jgi:formylglycine-generating enzyme required for sulfatase activity